MCVGARRTGNPPGFDGSWLRSLVVANSKMHVTFVTEAE
jgi:hypothetical protein